MNGHTTKGALAFRVQGLRFNGLRGVFPLAWLKSMLTGPASLAYKTMLKGLGLGATI